MRVPDLVLKCVGFLGDMVGGEFSPTATAFYVSVPSTVPNAGAFHYVVTAKHCTLGRNADMCLSAKTREGRIVMKPHDAPRHWYYHPTDPSVDVAVTPIIKSPELDFRSVSISSFLSPSSNQVGIGDEVFFPGLFCHAFGSEADTPIVRYGNIAMFPMRSVQIVIDGASQFAEVYLVEARSIGGISGSPVFARETTAIQLPIGKIGLPDAVQGVGGNFHLLGLMHGHWDVRESELNEPKMIPSARSVNSGLAMVVPAVKILETLNSPPLVAMRQDHDESLFSRRRGSLE